MSSSIASERWEDALRQTGGDSSLQESSTMTRRAFAIGGLLGSIGALTLSGAQAYEARYVNPYRPTLERVSIALPPEHAGLAGLRIGFVADTHVGPFISPDDVARATAMITQERPNLILLAGDYVSESPRYVGMTAEALAELTRESSLGAIAVLGNHDLHVSPSRIQSALEAVGIVVLRNEATLVTFRGEALWITGIDDTLLGRPDPTGTFAQVPRRAPAIALWHEPQFADATAALGALAQLSGHTHGGQIRLPGIGPVGLPQHGKRHVIGLSRARGMPVYTTRGVGVYRPPLRFNCPPEVTLITLVAPE